MSALPRVPLRAACLAAALLALPGSAFAWGFGAHHYIAQNYSKHLPPSIDGLRAYDATVDAHVTDPDTRRSSTPGEEYRHYIDIDSYSEFVFGLMPHDRATLEAGYGATFVRDTGVVPWAIGEVVTTLTQQFQAGQWSTAALTIADLCHYVGDATQPLHCTKNYNGQLTGNTGVHSRYETTMINAHLGELSTAVMPFAYYPSAVDAAFGIVSGSWDKVDDLLAADNAAKAASGGAYDATYYNALWANTQSCTRTRLDSASVVTASMVYTAWVNAGHPVVPGSSAGVPTVTALGASLEAGPLPFRDALSIRYGGAGPLDLEVYDVRGRRVAWLAAGVAAGSVTWRPAGALTPGLYFVRLRGAGFELSKRVTRLQ
jgi:hypothetical protein